MASGGEAVTTQQQQAAPRTTWWQILKSIAFQMLLFYLITSYFRGSKPNQTGSDGKPAVYAANVFEYGQEMELYVFLSESDEFFHDTGVEVWHEELVFGSWEDGVNGDGSRETSVEVAVPEEVQHNGTWFVHVLLVKSGYPLDPEDEYYDSEAMIHQYKMFNRYRRRRVHSTSNLLTGEADVAPDAIRSSEQAGNAPVEIISYFHPNLTLNVVYDNTRFVEGSVPPPMDKYIEFNSTGDGYFPVLYVNDYWNLAQEYTPLNDTVKTSTLYLTYTPLSFFRFQLYASVTRDNPWGQMLGQPDPSDEEQDTVKQTLMETSPYLLTLTVIVSIVHSVFEFLAFKNDVQFWRSRKSLEGLSVRSVFFNVFQSFIVLLYILDNETNTMVIIMIFIGLLIDLWKVTKVVEIKIDRENLIAGFVPRLTFVDRPSYVETSTKEYDKMAFKYLGWALFPLFIAYGIYSLLYQEHKGWYSFLLSMCYGFLLTFGFITMTPQLFINYKLKSVAHLPWRMLTYKALNTFIDDMFAFVIKMPTMYRIGCFRDDIVFFIYLYQRWIYRIDPKRVNEFGTTGEDDQHHAVSSPEPEKSNEANLAIKSDLDKKMD